MHKNVQCFFGNGHYNKHVTAVATLRSTIFRYLALHIFIRSKYNKGE